MNDEVVISANKLTKTFSEGKLHVDVLKGIDLSVNKNEMIAIVGASGSGKSTLLHCLGGLDKPTSGEVIVNGKNINQLSQKACGKLRNHYLGFIYQFHHLLSEFNALENVCMPLLIRGLKPSDAKEKANDIIEKVGLTNRRFHRIGELSGGERQRIAIARAIVTEPLCVLADEPTGNLDNKTAEHVFELMLSLNESITTSFIIVTHDTVLANRMNRVLTLQDGIFIPPPSSS